MLFKIRFKFLFFLHKQESSLANSRPNFLRKSLPFMHQQVDKPSFKTYNSFVANNLIDVIPYKRLFKSMIIITREIPSGIYSNPNGSNPMQATRPKDDNIPWLLHNSPAFNIVFQNWLEVNEPHSFLFQNIHLILIQNDLPDLSHILSIHCDPFTEPWAMAQIDCTEG